MTLRRPLLLRPLHDEHLFDLVVVVAVAVVAVPLAGADVAAPLGVLEVEVKKVEEENEGEKEEECWEGKTHHTHGDTHRSYRWPVSS